MVACSYNNQETQTMTDRQTSPLKLCLLNLMVLFVYLCLSAVSANAYWATSNHTHLHPHAVSAAPNYSLEIPSVGEPAYLHGCFNYATWCDVNWGWHRGYASNPPLFQSQKEYPIDQKPPQEVGYDYHYPLTELERLYFKLLFGYFDNTPQDVYLFDFENQAHNAPSS